jgi:TetR/AcrR family transcriptional repressor of nem operon
LGVSRDQARQNRRSIIIAAARLFRERGVDAVGLNELMKEAGFTQGGFYNHFESKDALVAEVVTSAMREGSEQFVKAFKASVGASTSGLERYIGHYLSQAHRDDVEHGCPVAGFASDVPRFGADAQAKFANGLDNLITLIAGLVAELKSGGDDDKRTYREQAISLYCKIIGALVVSRSVAASAPSLASEVLESIHRELSPALQRPSKQSPGKREESRRSPSKRKH